LKNKEDFKKFLSSISKSLLPIANVNPELITFMISAFWHGFYPNYYSFFFFAFIIEQCGALIDSKTYLFDTLDKYKEDSNIGKQAIFFFATFNFVNMLNYFAVYFSLLFMERAWKISVNFKFLPIIILMSGYVMLKNMKYYKPKPEKKIVSKEIKENKPQNTVEETKKEL
jgi:L-asparagine transporter-like permease